MRSLTQHKPAFSLTGLVPDRSRFTRRGLALLATILVHLLLLLLFLLSHAPETVKKAEDDGLKTFSVMRQAEKKNAGEKKSREKTRMADQAAPSATPKPTEPPPPSVAPRPKKETQIPSFINLSPSDLAAADIGKLPSRGAANGTGGSTGSSRSVAGPGEGPGGARLLSAEWVREPTRAEMSPFIPDNVPAGAKAYIACRTIEHFHVENCQVVWETPPGTGLGQGLRRAAWQFLVRPLHMEGQSLVGKDIGILYEIRNTARADGE